MLRYMKRIMRTAMGLDLLTTPEIKIDYITLGTNYGGWPIIPKLTKSDSVVYSFGVGEDASFDIELISSFGCVVHAFDPTPKSQDWVRKQEFPPAFQFYQWGIGAENGELTFYPPANPLHTSYSTKKDPHSTGKPMTAAVKNLPTIMRELGHDRVDVLKMDVEGTEYDVVKSLADLSLLPTQLMIEFHHGMYGYRAEETRKAIQELRHSGYQMYYRSRSGQEFAFVLRTI